MFDTALNATTNRDGITDFEPGAGTVGATLAADRFLAFDADANGKKASVAFAQLPLGVAALVTAADLQFIL